MQPITGPTTMAITIAITVLAIISGLVTKGIVDITAAVGITLGITIICMTAEGLRRFKDNLEFTLSEHYSCLKDNYMKVEMIEHRLDVLNPPMHDLIKRGRYIMMDYNYQADLSGAVLYEWITELVIMITKVVQDPNYHEAAITLVHIVSILQAQNHIWESLYYHKEVDRDKIEMTITLLEPWKSQATLDYQEQENYCHAHKDSPNPYCRALAWAGIKHVQIRQDYMKAIGDTITEHIATASSRVKGRMISVLQAGCEHR